jgi:hypothetical protein
MYRCNGRQWQEWGWGAAAEGFQYTALLKDSSDDDGQPASVERKVDAAGGGGKNGNQQMEMTTDSGNAIGQRRRSRKNNCLSGWTVYETDCYRHLADKLTWNEADAACRKDGGHLTEVKSSAHLVWLRKLAGEVNFWIGLNDKATPGAWTFTRSPTQSVRYFNWRRDFPRVTPARVRRLAGGRHCALVSSGGEWVNRPCDAVRAQSVCVQSGVRRRPMDF